MLPADQAEAVIYRLILAAAEADKPCPSNDTLAKAVHCRAHSTVSRILNDLEQQGRIKRKTGRYSRIVHFLRENVTTAPPTDRIDRRTTTQRRNGHRGNRKALDKRRNAAQRIYARMQRFQASKPLTLEEQQRMIAAYIKTHGITYCEPGESALEQQPI